MLYHDNRRKEHAMNDTEIEPDEDILVKDLITVRGRITDAYNP